MGVSLSLCFCTLSSMHQLELGKEYSDIAIQRLLEGTLLGGKRYQALCFPARTTLEQGSQLLCLPNELLAQILLCVDDYVDRYCLGLSCSKLFAICEQKWLVKYHEAFQRPRLLGTVGGLAWNQLPERCADLLDDVYRHRSAFDFKRRSAVSQDAFDAEALLSVQERTLQVDSIIEAMPVLPQPSTESNPECDPLSAILRQLGEKVWRRIVDCIVREHGGPYGTLSTVFSSADLDTAYAAAVSTGIPEAPILCRSLMFHTGTPTSTFSGTQRQCTVLRNHTKKMFVLYEPMRRILEECFPRKISALGNIDQVSECILFTRIMLPSFESGVPAPSFESGLLASTQLWGEWAGDELDMISEEDFRTELRSMSIDSLEQWVNNSGEIMKACWETALEESRYAEQTSLIEESKVYLDSQLHPGITALALSMLGTQDPI